MKMKKSMLASVIAASFACSTGVQASNDYSTEMNDEWQEQTVETQAVPPQVVTFIANQAKSFLISQATSFLREQIFGGSGGQTTVAILHEDSLDAIRNIVYSGFEQHRLITMQSEFSAYANNVRMAHQIAANGQYDSGVITNLLTQGFRLIDDPVYGANGYDYYFTLTGSRAMSYAMLLSVMTERSLNASGFTRADIAQYTGEWAANLSAMGAAADSFIMRNVSVEYMPYQCIGTIIFSEPPLEAPEYSTTSSYGARCETVVHDRINNRSRGFRAALYGYDGANSSAAQLANQWRAEYREKFKGSDFNAVIEEFENFGI